MKLSVALVTYNHQNYIAKAIESVLFQKTSFEFEIVIGEDCSTDNTKNICAEYQAKYPDKIRLLPSCYNKGLVNNLLNIINECKGEYIAVFEGDDYWIDEYKLQKQVDFLDNNPDCAFCYTNSYKFLDDNEEQKEVMIKNSPPQKFDLEYYLETSPLIVNMTKVFRKSAHPKTLPPFVYNYLRLDFILHILHAEQGKIGYLNDITCCYRVHSKSITRSNANVKTQKYGLIAIYNLEKYFNPRFKNIFSRYKLYLYEEIAFAYLYKKKYLKFTNYLFYSFRFGENKNLLFYFKIIRKIASVIFHNTFKKQK